MRSNLLLFLDQRGWISLPIIGLLLAVSSVSMHYQESMMASYQWRGQLSDVDKDQLIWTEFERQFVDSADFAGGSVSLCQGFCELNQAQYTPNEKTWQAASNSALLYYQWHRYENADTTEFHRLCASQNQRQYQCWWWRDRQLSFDGWVRVVD
ncbi:hypothetical protein J9B83_08445 [Marinomonas sp. A79]|uniref:Uncharacterized protein n=1 Tax=Marinomonas vulgaris TaxID=2823372 RepID=A0ABS5HBE4_9GAMM|nr:hypothetical protein [Marinomonas vulgaris]MBR7888976.1 hypothetical protein [Marinomonas vulgaris]